MNVLMILQSDFPPDIRVEREANSLQKNGYHVSLLCDNRVERSRIDTYGGISIYRMRHFNGYAGRLHRFLNIPIYPNHLWMSALKRAIVTVKPSVLHVHDLPLAMVAIHFGRLYHLPVILDLHEDYPAILEQWYKKNISGLTVRNPKLARIFEIICLKLVNRIIVIGDEHKLKLIRSGIPGRKIHVVENTPILNKYLNIRTDFRKKIVKNHSYNICYFGIINPERNLDLVIDSLPRIINKINHVKLMIIGDGPHLESLKKHAQKRSVENYIDFFGWVDTNDAITIIQKCDVCIIPHLVNSAMNIGVPNKLFEYMAIGKPVVISNSISSSKIVKLTQCGEIYMENNAISFSEAIFKVFKSKIKYGQNGKNAIISKFNWEKTEIKLLSIYEGLINEQ